MRIASVVAAIYAFKTMLLWSFYDKDAVAKEMQIINFPQGIFMKYRQIQNQHPQID